LSKMHHSCKKIWICHENYSESMREFLEDKVSAAAYATGTNLIHEEMKKGLSSFDCVISPSRIDTRTMKKEYGMPTYDFDLYLPKSDSRVDWGKERYILLSGSGSWFRAKNAQMAVQPLVDRLNSRKEHDIKLYIFSRPLPQFPDGPSVRKQFRIEGFEPWAVGCGIVPNEYKAGCPSKIYSHLACGFPSFMHPNMYEDYKDEVGIHPYVIENVIQSVEESWREKDGPQILESLTVRHGIEKTSKTWMNFLQQVTSTSS
jgi:hypothetical protein